MDTYHNLVTDLDKACNDSAAHHGDRLKCRPGCSDCCKPFSVLAVEAAAMREALAQLDQATRSRIGQAASAQTEHCPFLLDNLCAIYARRPLICRSQGLAIAYIDHQRQAIEVSACPINFPADEQFPFTEQDFFFMDAFNDRLAALNHDFCAIEGLPPEQRTPFAALATQP